MNKTNRLFSVLISVLILVCAFSLPAFAANVSIDDRSELLTDSEKEKSLGEINSVASEYDININIVTDDFYDGTDDNAGKNFSFDYYRSIYGEDVQNGVILAIDNVGGSGNRYIYILASGSCSDHIDEYDIDDITLELQTYVADNDIPGCISAFLKSVNYYMSIEPSTDDYYGDNSDYHGDNNYDSDNSDYNSGSYRWAVIKANAGKIILFAFIGGAIAAVVAVVIVKKKYKQFGIVKGIDANAVSSVNLNGSTDDIINRVVTTRRLPRNDDNDNGGHSDGFSGGHTDSDFSGGGRGF